LVYVGNWENSSYGRDLKARFSYQKNIITPEPFYEPSELSSIRDRADHYVHVHSASGTNPALVKMMHSDILILANGCLFIRCTTENEAMYFGSEREILAHLSRLDEENNPDLGDRMQLIAQRRYT
jgi:hypothetical protein